MKKLSEIQSMSTGDLIKFYDSNEISFSQLHKEIERRTSNNQRTLKEIEDMFDFIGFFNDGLFMNQDYRRGILKGLGYAKGYGDLEDTKNKLKSFFFST